MKKPPSYLGIPGKQPWMVGRADWNYRGHSHGRATIARGLTEASATRLAEVLHRKLARTPKRYSRKGVIYLSTPSIIWGDHHRA